MLCSILNVELLDKMFHFRDIPECLEVASEIKKQIEDFRPYIPLIQGLRNPGMRNRCELMLQILYCIA